MRLQYELTPETRAEVEKVTRSVSSSARLLTWGLLVLAVGVVAAALIHKHVKVSHLKGGL